MLKTEEFDDAFLLAFRMLFPRQEPCPCYEALLRVTTNDTTWKSFVTNLNHVRDSFMHEILRTWTERIERNQTGASANTLDEEIERTIDAVLSEDPQ